MINIIEKSLIERSYHNNDRSMSEVIFTHYDYKIEQLEYLRSQKKIPKVSYKILRKKIDNEFLNCYYSMKDLVDKKQMYYKKYVHAFEHAIHKLDSIDVNCKNVLDAFREYIKE